MQIEKHQLVAKDESGNVVEAITAPLSYSSALFLLGDNPYLLKNREHFNIYWGNVLVSAAVK